jgi:hypothetical protein
MVAGGATAAVRQTSKTSYQRAPGRIISVRAKAP